MQPGAEITPAKIGASYAKKTLNLLPWLQLNFVPQTTEESISAASNNGSIKRLGGGVLGILDFMMLL